MLILQIVRAKNGDASNSDELYQQAMQMYTNDLLKACVYLEP